MAAGQQPPQRATWEGFSNALTLVTLIFVLAGLWLDSRLGTRPVFTVALALLAVVGLGVRAFYSYKAQIARDEEGKPWTRSRP